MLSVAQPSPRILSVTDVSASAVSKSPDTEGRASLAHSCPVWSTGHRVTLPSSQEALVLNPGPFLPFVMSVALSPS